MVSSTRRSTASRRRAPRAAKPVACLAALTVALAGLTTFQGRPSDAAMMRPVAVTGRHTARATVDTTDLEVPVASTVGAAHLSYPARPAAPRTDPVLLDGSSVPSRGALVDFRQVVIALVALIGGVLLLVASRARRR